MSNNHKIIFTGPVGAGKTTAISSLSDTPIVSTDEVASDMTSSRKKNTTVAMDYGLMNLSNSERIHLYGTPGQERFNFMWDILTQGGLGIILLVDNTRKDPFKDLQFFLKAFHDFAAQQRAVIGVTRMDERRSPTIDEYNHQLVSAGLKLPIFEIDARIHNDVRTLLRALLYSIDPGLHGKSQ